MLNRGETAPGTWAGLSEFGDRWARARRACRFVRANGTILNPGKHVADNSGTATPTGTNSR